MKKPIFRGVYRSSFEEIVERTKDTVVMCSCRQMLHVFNQLREHWQLGHFDEVVEDDGVHRDSEEVVVPSLPPCVIGVRCERHDFVHGAEAEELREKLEEYIKTVSGDNRWAQRILDEVDARDSVAWVEFENKEACLSGWHTRKVSTDEHQT